jgi:DNA helicase-2/ATP-dependent DNA helicase PcrA
MPKAAQNPAEKAAEVALKLLYGCIEERKNFRLEAGAGAGKTYSLISALRFLILGSGAALLRQQQNVACITYTNVAKAQIESRTDRHTAIYCDTIHGFCWSAIKDFQPQLRKELPLIEKWAEKLQESGGVGMRTIEYTLGHGKVHPDCISLYHNDVVALFVALMKYEKFRALLVSRYPILFIDEYQDTDVGFAEALKTHFLGAKGGPLIGLFGDHWQKIYSGVCGKLESAALTTIGKEANFRSVKAVVDVLNRMRPELPQYVKDPDAQGFVGVYHTNDWGGERRTEANWKSELPPNIAHQYLEVLREKLTTQGWEFGQDKSKILMLTHNVLAAEQGYRNLAGVFEYTDSFINKEDVHIAFLVDILEPFCLAYENKRFGEAFAVMAGSPPAIHSRTDKLKWASDMHTLFKLRLSGNIGAVIDHLRHTQHPPIPDSVERKEHDLGQLGSEPTLEEGSPLEILYKLRSISYQEVIALDRFLDGHTPFATKHGVKGAEFENVLVVIGKGGWNRYNFNQMLELAGVPGNIPPSKWDAFERARNLFYVACSRPKKRLALLFTQEISKEATATLSAWFGKESIHSLPTP